jgi:prevent-host-death family protein
LKKRNKGKRREIKEDLHALQVVLVKHTEKKSKSYSCFSFALVVQYLVQLIRRRKTMEAVAYSNFRQNLKQYMKQVNEDADALIVTAKDAEDTVVVLSKREYDSLQESLRILSNSYLMEKIRRGDTQFRKKNFKTHDLLKVKEDD